MVTNHAGTGGNRRGPDGYRCCEHCNEDEVHDVTTDGHDIPCQTCDDPGALVRELASRLESALRAERAKVARVEALADDMDERGRPGPKDSPTDTTARWQIREDAKRLRAALGGAE